MEKEALISVILNDLKEVETLVKAMGSPAKINSAYFKLTVQKIDSIKSEIALLEEINATIETNVDVNSNKSETVNEEPIVSLSKQEDSFDLVSSEKIETINKSQTSEEPAKENLQADSVSFDEEIVVEEKPDTSSSVETTDTNDASPKTDIKVSTTLGESINKDKTLIADKIGSSITVNNKLLIGKPVDDIKKAIGINDRFLFQRELFSGNESLMSQTLSELNEFKSFSEAETFLKSNFTWDFQNETVDAFYKVVQRKFIS